MSLRLLQPRPASPAATHGRSQVPPSSQTVQPRDAVAIDQILKSMGSTDHHPRVVHQLLEFMHSARCRCRCRCRNTRSLLAPRRV
jgi:hypothetical protein